MKKTLFFAIAILFATQISAQNPTAYFMEGTTFRSQLNPAFAPLRGYVNIPGLGNINANVSGNLSLDNVLFPRNGKLVTLIDSSVSAADALSGLNPQNLLGVDSRVNIIGFGAFTRSHKNFWSFDLNVRAIADANIPYSLVEFIKLGKDAKIGGIGVMADSYVEAGFNYSFPILRDRMYLGVRAKFLIGAAHAKLQYDRFDVTMFENQWRVQASGRLDISASGLDIRTQINEQGDEIYNFDDINLKPKGPAGYGFAVDLGTTFDILPNLQASLAVNDLGFISWSRKHSRTGYSAKELSFKGVEINDGITSSQPDFDFDILEFEPREAASTTRMLRAAINAGLEYNVWRHKIGLGLLYTARLWQYETLHNLTGSVNFHPIRWFTVTGSYSVIDNRGGAVGLALNLNPNWINFYIATDVLTVKHTPQFIPIKQTQMNVTLGLGIPIGKRSYRIPRYMYGKDFK